MTSLSSLFIEGRRPDTVVAWRGGERIPFSRFRADVGAATTRLIRERCRRGALVCRDSYFFLVGLFALLASGAEAVIPPNSQAGTLTALAGAWDILVSDDPALPGPQILLPASAESDTSIPREPLDGTLAMFTSGSTGTAKRVLRPLRDLDREVTELERLWGDIVENPVVHTTVPHHHIYGLTFSRLWPLAAGRPFAATVWEVWESLFAALAAPSIIISSPAHLTRLGGLAPIATERQPRLVFSAGAPLSFRAAHEASSILGPLPTEIYGSTETGAIATRRQQDERTPWRPLPGVVARQQADGRLQISSPWVNDAQWFDTEDAVEPAGEEAAFHLVGRVDRVVKIEGKRIALADIEHRLASLPWIVEAAAVALPGEPETLAAAVVLTPEGVAEHQRLGAFRFARLLRRDLAAFHDAPARPRRWRFVTELPSGAMGKRSAAAIIALFRDSRT
jgi:acyl-coenzyme A synthetase/AMP-(fatty) acid ligase